MAEYPVRATLGGVLLFVIGLAIAASTVVSELRDRERRAAWLTADGNVVDMLPGPAGGSPRPVVSFDTPEGERVRFTPITRGPWPAPKLGDTVPVIYPFGLPAEARIDPRGLRWTRAGIALGAALLLMGLGGYVAWYAHRRDAERPSAVE
jgi:hypothetical protein